VFIHLKEYYLLQELGWPKGSLVLVSFALTMAKVVFAVLAGRKGASPVAAFVRDAA
jgi:hypothetical protein